jgi:hypothetical protein
MLGYHTTHQIIENNRKKQQCKIVSPTLIIIKYTDKEKKNITPSVLAIDKRINQHNYHEKYPERRLGKYHWRLENRFKQVIPKQHTHKNKKNQFTG